MNKLLVIYISGLCSLHSFSQNDNSFNGYFAVKANVGDYKDNDSKRFSNGVNNNDGPSHGGINGKSSYITQTFGKSTIFMGGEIDYYFNRTSFFGMNIGLAYSFDKTYYNYSSQEHISSPPNTYTQTNINGNGNLQNHLYKFVYSFNFNTKSGFNFYIQPLNPELRIIKDGKSVITIDTYNGYYKTPITSPYPQDSTSTLVSSETKNFEFVNYKTGANFSIAFPSLIGIEQKFKIGKLNYVAGASAAFSALEWYAIYRVHFGICFGSFKK